MAGASVLTAQNKITPEGLRLLNDYRAQESVREAASRGMATPAKFYTHSDAEIPSTVCALVTLESEGGAEALRAAGYEVESVIGRVAIVNMPVSRTESLAAMPQVVQISMGKELTPMLNKARAASHVTEVQEGTDLPQAYDGTGVIAGLMDTGLDPNHVNFRNADGKGDSRVKMVWTVTGRNAAVATYSTPTQIERFTTDNSGETHGTHVLGIIAGAYNGAGTYGTISKTGNAMQGKTKVPYYGVARGADLAVAGGTLSDACIAKAVGKIVEYAETEGKPVVVNLSLGSTIGPHDGTDGICQVLAELGKKAIICVSSGNDGMGAVSIPKTFTSTDTQFKTVVNPTSNNTYEGTVDAWCNTSDLFTGSFLIIDTNDGSVAYRHDVSDNLFGGTYIIGSSQYAGYANVDETPAEFTKAFTGTVTLSSNISTSNNRYNVSAYFEMSRSSGNSDGRYVPALMYSGAAGVSMTVFSPPGMSLGNGDMAGFTAGSPVNSANDMACGDNVLAVGSYNSRNSWPVYMGTFRYLGGYQAYADTYYPVGGMSPFTSYGVQVNGKSVPTFCAPGCMIVSSISTPYFNRAGLTNAAIVGVAQSELPNTSTVRQNYWDAMMGTSMASPYAAGVCTLMLQADPTLTYEKVREIITSTCVRDEPVISAFNQVQWGAGKLNALEALKKTVAQSAGVGTVMADDMNFFVTPVADGYEVFAAGDTALRVTLYDIQGRPVAEARGNADGTATVSTSGLRGGIYILTATGTTGTHTRKLALP